MTKKISVLSHCLLWLFLSSQTLAQEASVCSDLAKLSCAPGTYDDGTGTVKGEEQILDLMQKHGEKGKEELKLQFKKMLSSPSNKDFFLTLVSAFGLDLVPQCSSESPADREWCRGTVIDRLVTIAQRDIMGPLLPSLYLRHPTAALDQGQKLRKHPVYKKIINEFIAITESDLIDKNLRKAIKEEYFPEIKALLIERIQKLGLDQKIEGLMISKINGIVFDDSGCNDDISYEKGDATAARISEAFYSNANYSAKHGAIQICSGLTLFSNSLFSLGFVIAHELSHSIDPCNLPLTKVGEDFFDYLPAKTQKKQDEQYPVKNVVSCLRDEKSVAALTLEQAREKFGKKISSPIGVIEGKKDLPFCLNDQIGEAFSDWMASEILPKFVANKQKLTREQYRIGYSNVHRVQCKVSNNDSSHREFEVHPDTEHRINRIVLANPSIRGQMGCTSHSKDILYCESGESQIRSENENSESHDAKKNGITK